MLNGYEIAMLLMIAASLVYMMWRLFKAIELERSQKEAEREKSGVPLISATEQVSGTGFTDNNIEVLSTLVPVEIAEVGMKLFLEITAHAWQLTPEQQQKILGIPAANFEPEIRTPLNHSMLLIISHLTSIYRALHTIFPDAQQANSWIKKENSAFDNKAVLQLLMSGDLNVIARVRHYLVHQVL